MCFISVYSTVSSIEAGIQFGETVGAAGIWIEM